MQDIRSDIAPMMLAVSSYVASAIERDLPAEVVDKAKLHILDSLAAIVAGIALKPGKVACAFVEAQGGTPECTVGKPGLKTSAVNAAFANGMLAAGGETDDSHFLARMHPGCAIVPPTLAIAEREDCSGTDFLRSVVLGYDIGCRLTISLDEALLDGAFHSPHSIGGLFGGTAGCSALLGFDEEHVRYAFSFAVQQAAGVTCWMRDPEHVEKAFVFGGNPARNAAAAALMISYGFNGGSDPFHGQHNFLDCMSPSPDRSVMARGLGEDFEIMRAMIKKWTVGSPIQAAIESTQALLKEHGFSPDQIVRVNVTMPDKETKIITNRHMPEICVEHLVSLMLVDGDVTFSSAHDYARMSDERVLAVRRKVELVPSAEMTRTPPPRQARVDIELEDGRKLSHFTGAVLGTPDNPMSRADVAEKSIRVAAPALGEAGARKLVDAVWDIESVSARELCALIAGG